MKKFTPIFIVACLVFAAHPAESAIFVVDNNGGNSAHYATFNAARDAASDGDTLYVVGSPTDYGHHSVDKLLTIIGPGYGLDQNSGNQASVNSARISFEFVSGSEGSVAMGLQFSNSVLVYANNITIERCHCNFWAYYGILIRNVSGTVIKQCYLINTNNENSDVRSAIRIEDAGADNITISNCFLYNPKHAISTEWESGPIYVDRCVMSDSLLIHNTTVTNSILRFGDLRGGPNSFFNSLCNGTQFPAENGNIQNVDMGTVFVGTGSFDSQWQLAAGSPAIDAAVDEGDCGMFGGLDPYVLSGIPPVPTISWFYAPASGSPATGLNVQMTVKARN